MFREREREREGATTHHGFIRLFDEREGGREIERERERGLENRASRSCSCSSSISVSWRAWSASTADNTLYYHFTVISICCFVQMLCKCSGLFMQQL